MKRRPFFSSLFLLLVTSVSGQEVFSVDSINRTLSPAGNRYSIAHPFEIAYGRDDSLYITEKIGRVLVVSAQTGQRRIILDYRNNIFLNITRGAGGVATSIGQNGMMGLALHKDFKAPVPVNYIYIAYAYNTSSARISRFTYNTATGQLEAELILLNGIPAGNDHSSGRLVYGPDDKLYYSCGDLGANQFANKCNPIRAQDLPTDAEISASNFTKYQGKILRLNLDGTIPGDNPALDPDGAGGEVPAVSHIYTLGHRNPQGLVFEMDPNNGSTYPVLKPNGFFYSSEHGIRTDDEINLIAPGNNYGWPYWAGLRNNPTENYRYINWSTATNCSSIPGYNEVTVPAGAVVMQENAFAPGTFTEPIFSMYPACNGANNCNVTLTTGTNWMEYPTIAPGSIDHYGFTNIPGWHQSLLLPTLRRGTLYRYKLNATRNGIVNDSIPYFFRTDRYRDLALKNGTIIFTVTDSIGSTSGPSGSGTSVLTRPGTILKYTFLGYQNSVPDNRSTLPGSIGVTTGTNNTCNPGTPVTIDATNNLLWVPITGPDGNIMAEIFANGNNLGLVTSSFYQHNGTLRTVGSNRYLDRNITINVQNPPTLPVGNPLVRVRFYVTAAEYNALDLDPLSGVNSIGDVKILRNSDACAGAVSGVTTLINPTYAEMHGSNNGYVLQAELSGFSSFYFGSANLTLPLDLLTFTGALQRDRTALLQWTTANEINTTHFTVERSMNGADFILVGTVAAHGNGSSHTYAFTDTGAAHQGSRLLYYRLKMTDADGSSKYSRIVVISTADITGVITASPNPVTGETRIHITAPADGKLQWKMADQTGRLLQYGTLVVKKGEGNNLTLDMQKLAGGIYYLEVWGKDIRRQLKLLRL